jgi:putative transposase
MSYEKSTHLHGYSKLARFQKPDTTSGAKVDRKDHFVWKKNFSLKEHIWSIHQLHPHFGYKRMTRALSRERIVVNHKRMRRLMRELGIQSVIRKKRPFYGRRRSVVLPNVLNREFCAENPFQKLVTDITYVRVGDTFACLSAVLDLYNNEIVAWELSERNDLELVLNTLKQLDGKPFGKNALDSF